TADPADLDQLARMVAAGAHLHAELDPARYRAPPPNQISPMLASLLQEKSDLDRGIILAAERSQTLVGTAMIQRRKGARKLLRKAENVLHITWIWVEPEYRKAGIARALLFEAERHARQAGIPQIRCEISGANEPSKLLFGNQGFSVTQSILCKSIASDSSANTRR
ncbi:MAG: GNAT family N-acetyltransferase, partial [Pseudomonadota bacterium]